MFRIWLQNDPLTMHYLAEIPGLLHKKYIENPLYLKLANSAFQLNFDMNRPSDHPAAADQNYGILNLTGPNINTLHSEPMQGPLRRIVLKNRHLSR